MRCSHPAIVAASVLSSILNLGTSLKKDYENIDIWEILRVIYRELFSIVIMNSFLAIILYLFIWLIFKIFSQIQELNEVKWLISFSVAWILASRLTAKLKVDQVNDLMGGIDLNAFPVLKTVFKDIISFLDKFYDDKRKDIAKKIAFYESEEEKSIINVITENQISVTKITESLNYMVERYPFNEREEYLQKIKEINSLNEISETKLKYLVVIIRKIYTREQIKKIKRNKQEILSILGIR